jgi:hypothetical protein
MINEMLFLTSSGVNIEHTQHLSSSAVSSSDESNEEGK